MRQFINIIENAELQPIRTFDRLWHVGSMVASAKRKGSYEGAGLSVSRHPNAWTQIARGHVNGDIWELTKPNNRFLDYHAMPYRLKTQIRQWGIEQGYIEETTHFRIRYYDDEWEQERWMDFNTREEAEEEAEMMDLENPIEEITDALKATPKLDARTMNAGGDMEALVPVWVEDMTDLDGVWWQDSYDPDRLSAPRGVIMQSKMREWSATKPSVEPEDDDDDYDGGPETPWGAQ